MSQEKLSNLNVLYTGKKGGKSGDLNETMKLLVSSFGGERALARKSPICAGRYNSTKANEVRSKIFLAINFHAGRKAAVEHLQV